MKGIALTAWVISILIWFLRNLGCLKVALSKTNRYERVETTKYSVAPPNLERSEGLLALTWVYLPSDEEQ